MGVDDALNAVREYKETDIIATLQSRPKRVLKYVTSILPGVSEVRESKP
jgi:hypothetical protein